MPAESVTVAIAITAFFIVLGGPSLGIQQLLRFPKAGVRDLKVAASGTGAGFAI